MFILWLTSYGAGNMANKIAASGLGVNTPQLRRRDYTLMMSRYIRSILPKAR